MELTVKDFQGFTEKSDFRVKGAVTKNQYIRGDCLKRKRLDNLCIKGGWQERGCGVFERGSIP